MSGIFQNADQVAQKYIQEVEVLTAHQKRELREQAEQAREEADKLVADAKMAATAIRDEADAYLANAKAEVDDYWKKVNSQVQVLLEGQDMLKSIVLFRRKE